MDKKQYILPAIRVAEVSSQSILVASDGRKMLDYSKDNGSVNYDDDDEITDNEDIWYSHST